MSSALQADQVQAQYQNCLAKHHSKLNSIHLPKFMKNKLGFSHLQDLMLSQIF